jgi:dolichol-phosphate mannosyltransferase
VVSVEAKRKTQVLVVTPAYSEWPNLEILGPQIESELKDYSSSSKWVVISESNPPIEQMNSLKNFCSNSLVIPRDANKSSFASALQLGIDQINSQHDIVIFMDGDNSHNPKMISRLVHPLLENHELDVVIASRYVRGGSSDNPVVLRLMSRALNLAFRLVVGIQARDLSTNFKAFRSSLLMGASLTSKNFEAVEEILLVAQFKNGSKLRILEIPDHFRARLHGNSKRKLGQFIGSYLLSLWRLRQRVRAAADVKE